MRAKFDEQLNMLNQEMMHIGTMIEHSIQKAIEALVDQDVELAKSIMDSDVEIDREQKKIENLCFNLLMQQQPVARDLRVISAAMKMVTDMERIGDHASDISEMTIMMSKKPYTLDMGHIHKMAGETVLMLIQSIEAYVEKDMKKAAEFINRRYGAGTADIAIKESYWPDSRYNRGLSSIYIRRRRDGVKSSSWKHSDASCRRCLGNL